MHSKAKIIACCGVGLVDSVGENEVPGWLDFVPAVGLGRAIDNRPYIDYMATQPAKRLAHSLTTQYSVMPAEAGIHF